MLKEFFKKWLINILFSIVWIAILIGLVIGVGFGFIYLEEWMGLIIAGIVLLLGTGKTAYHDVQMKKRMKNYD